MKLYLITQDVNNGYDTYDSAVVVATSAAKARQISPSGSYKWVKGEWHFLFADGTTKPSDHTDWATPDRIEATLIGVASEKLKAGEVVCASFNAG